MNDKGNVHSTTMKVKDNPGVRKPFKCMVCQGRFTSPTHLQNHLRDHHIDRLREKELLSSTHLGELHRPLLPSSSTRDTLPGPGGLSLPGPVHAAQVPQPPCSSFGETQTSPPSSNSVQTQYPQKPSASLSLANLRKQLETHDQDYFNYSNGVTPRVLSSSNQEQIKLHQNPCNSLLDPQRGPLHSVQPQTQQSQLPSDSFSETERVPSHSAQLRIQQPQLPSDSFSEAQRVPSHSAQLRIQQPQLPSDSFSEPQRVPAHSVQPQTQQPQLPSDSFSETQRVPSHSAQLRIQQPQLPSDSFSETQRVPSHSAQLRIKQPQLPSDSFSQPQRVPSHCAQLRIQQPQIPSDSFSETQRLLQTSDQLLNQCQQNESAPLGTVTGSLSDQMQASYVLRDPPKSNITNPRSHTTIDQSTGDESMLRTLLLTDEIPRISQTTTDQRQILNSSQLVNTLKHNSQPLNPLQVKEAADETSAQVPTPRSPRTVSKPLNINSGHRSIMSMSTVNQNTSSPHSVAQEEGKLMDVVNNQSTDSAHNMVQCSLVDQIFADLTQSDGVNILSPPSSISEPRVSCSTSHDLEQHLNHAGLTEDGQMNRSSSATDSATSETNSAISETNSPISILKGSALDALITAVKQENDNVTHDLGKEKEVPSRTHSFLGSLNQAYSTCVNMFDHATLTQNANSSMNHSECSSNVSSQDIDRIFAELIEQDNTSAPVTETVLVGSINSKSSHAALTNGNAVAVTDTSPNMRDIRETSSDLAKTPLQTPFTKKEIVEAKGVSQQTSESKASILADPLNPQSKELSEKTLVSSVPDITSQTHTTVNCAPPSSPKKKEYRVSEENCPTNAQNCDIKVESGNCEQHGEAKTELSHCSCQEIKHQSPIPDEIKDDAPNDQTNKTKIVDSADTTNSKALKYKVMLDVMKSNFKNIFGEALPSDILKTGTQSTSSANRDVTEVDVCDLTAAESPDTPDGKEEHSLSQSLPGGPSKQTEEQKVVNSNENNGSYIKQLNVPCLSQQNVDRNIGLSSKTTEPSLEQRAAQGPYPKGVIQKPFTFKETTEPPAKQSICPGQYHQGDIPSYATQNRTNRDSLGLSLVLDQVQQGTQKVGSSNKDPITHQERCGQSQKQPTDSGTSQQGNIQATVTSNMRDVPSVGQALVPGLSQQEQVLQSNINLQVSTLSPKGTKPNPGSSPYRKCLPPKKRKQHIALPEGLPRSAPTSQQCTVLSNDVPKTSTVTSPITITGGTFKAQCSTSSTLPSHNKGYVVSSISTTSTQPSMQHCTFPVTIQHSSMAAGSTLGFCSPCDPAIQAAVSTSPETVGRNQRINISNNEYCPNTVDTTQQANSNSQEVPRTPALTLTTTVGGHQELPDASLENVFLTQGNITRVHQTTVSSCPYLTQKSYPSALAIRATPQHRTIVTSTIPSSRVLPSRFIQGENTKVVSASRPNNPLSSPTVSKAYSIESAPVRVNPCVVVKGTNQPVVSAQEPIGTGNDSLATHNGPLLIASGPVSIYGRPVVSTGTLATAYRPVDMTNHPVVTCYGHAVKARSPMVNAHTPWVRANTPMLYAVMRSNSSVRSIDQVASAKYLVAINTVPIVPANGPVVTANGPVVAVNGLVVTANDHVVTVNGPIVTANDPVVSVNGPVVTANGPVVTVNGPIVTANDPVVSVNGPVVTANGPVVTVNGPVVTANDPVVSVNGPILTVNAPAGMCNGPIINAPAPVTNSYGPVSTDHRSGVRSNGPGAVPEYGPMVSSNNMLITPNRDAITVNGCVASGSSTMDRVNHPVVTGSAGLNGPQVRSTPAKSYGPVATAHRSVVTPNEEVFRGDSPRFTDKGPAHSPDFEVTNTHMQPHSPTVRVDIPVVSSSNPVLRSHGSVEISNGPVVISCGPMDNVTDSVAVVPDNMVIAKCPDVPFKGTVGAPPDPMITCNGHVVSECSVNPKSLLAQDFSIHASDREVAACSPLVRSPGSVVSATEPLVDNNGPSATTGESEQEHCLQTDIPGAPQCRSSPPSSHMTYHHLSDTQLPSTLHDAEIVSTQNDSSSPSLDGTSVHSNSNSPSQAQDVPSTAPLAPKESNLTVPPEPNKQEDVQMTSISSSSGSTNIVEEPREPVSNNSATSANKAPLKDTSEEKKQKKQPKPRDYRKKYTCEVCQKLCLGLKEYYSHSQAHSSEANTCMICKRQFQHRNRYLKHVKYFHEGKNCQKCGKKFRSAGGLRLHTRRMHTKREKKFLCDICGYRSVDVHLHKQHIKLHGTDKPYKCKVCSKSFARSDYLYRHMPAHEGEKPFICAKCGKGFTRKQYLDMHLSKDVCSRPAYEKSKEVTKTTKKVKNIDRKVLRKDRKVNKKDKKVTSNNEKGINHNKKGTINEANILEEKNGTSRLLKKHVVQSKKKKKHRRVQQITDSDSDDDFESSPPLNPKKKTHQASPPDSEDDFEKGPTLRSKMKVRQSNSSDSNEGAVLRKSKRTSKDKNCPMNKKQKRKNVIYSDSDTE